MALSYDPGSRKWNVSYEKTDNKTDYSTDNKTTKRVYVATWWVTVASGKAGSSYKVAQIRNTPIPPSKGKWVGEMDIDRDATSQSINSALGVQPERLLSGYNLLPGIKNKIVEQDTLR
jgi:hypothetical protein